MSKAISCATIVLAVAPGIAAWVLETSLDFEWLVFLGTVALVGAILTFGRPLPRWIRLSVAGFAGLSLLGTTGLRMRAMAAIRPFSAYSGWNQKDLTEVTLPVASQGMVFLESPHLGRAHVMFTLDGWGVLSWRGVPKTLGDVDEILQRSPGAEVRVYCDQDVPYQLLRWLGASVATHGVREMMFLAERFARSPDEARDLDAEYSAEHWPVLAFPVPIAAVDGPTLRILAAGWREGLWPPVVSWRPDDIPRSTQRIATSARYLWDGRETDDLRELGRWIRSAPPARIEADPEVPIKYVVAAENEIRKAGHPPAALVLPPPPPEALRKARYLPYPLPR